jgi:beta-lactamase regulating signal transducer with metallopeptidase domain
VGTGNHDALSALGSGLLHAVWIGGVVTAWAAGALWVLRGAPAAWRHALALAALMAMAGAVPLGALAARASADAWPRWLAVGWLAGVAVLIIRLLHGLTLVRGLRRRARPLAAPWPQRLGAVAATLGVRRHVALAESDDIEVPCSVGELRPAVLLPADATSGLGPAAFDAIAAHELGHVRRHDYGWNLLQQVLEALLFFHPARPWLSRTIARERESSCDAIARAVTTPVAVARGLARLEARRHASRPLGAATSRASLLPRVHDLLAPAAAPAPPTRFALALLSVATVGVTAALGLVAWSGAGAPDLKSSFAAPWLAAGGLGLLVGLRHALEPDHLVAVATLVPREQDAPAAARVGLAWGAGHAATLLMVGSLLVGARTAMPAGIERALEAAVAVMVTLMGLRSLADARQLASEGALRTHTHGGLVHAHRTSAAHLHLGPFALARGPFLVGTVHGLAGSGALTALAVASLPSAAAQVGFMAVFGAGSAMGMAAVAGLAGWPLGHLLHRRTTVATMSAVSGVAAVMVGLSWGWPLLALLAKG